MGSSIDDAGVPPPHPEWVMRTNPPQTYGHRMPVAAPVMPDDALADMLSLIRDSNSVELKLTIPAAQQRSAIMALGLDPLGAQVRLVYFFDTPDLTLEGHGVVVRARRVAQKGDDSVVKLRPVVPSELPSEVRDSPSCMIEVDAMPGGYVCSASMKGVPRTPVADVAAGAKSPRKLFSKEQRAFYEAHAPDGIELDDLSLLGPIFVAKIKGTPQGFARKMVVELWLYPDGARILELSTKCLPDEAFQVAAESRAFLAERGIKPSASAQTTKTRKALGFFSKQLSAS